MSSLSREILFDRRPGCFIGVPLSIGVFPAEGRCPALHVAAAAPKGTHRTYRHRSRRHLSIGTTKLQARRLRVTGQQAGRPSGSQALAPPTGQLEDAVCPERLSELKLDWAEEALDECVWPPFHRRLTSVERSSVRLTSSCSTISLLLAWWAW